MKDDLQLLISARKMDGKALAEISNQYTPALYKYAFRLSTDAVMANRIVGDVFTKLLDQVLSRNGSILNLRLYLFKMTYHLLHDEGHDPCDNIQLDVVDTRGGDGCPLYRSSEDRILFERVSLVIRYNLTNDQRHVILLRFQEGFSLKETALIMGKSVSNVKVIQSRAVAALRRVLPYGVETSTIVGMLGNALQHQGSGNQEAAH